MAPPRCHALRPFMPARRLAEENLDRVAQTLLVAWGEAPQGFADEGAIEGGEHRLDGRGLEQTRALPVLHDDLAEVPTAADLAGDGHQDQIAPRAVIGEARDDDPRTLLGGGLVCKGEWYQHHIPELIGHVRNVPA